MKTYDSPVRHCYLHSHHCHHIYSRCTNTFHCRKRIRKGKNKFVQLCLYLWGKVVAKSQKRNIIITYCSLLRHCCLHSHHCHHIYSRCTNTFHCRKRIRKGKNKFVQLCLYLWGKVVAKSQKRNIIITYCSLLRHCCLRSHCCHYTGTPSAHVHYCHTRIHEDNQVAVELPLYYRERDVKKFSLSYNIQKRAEKAHK